MQNLAGTIAPVVIGLAVVPSYLHLIGTARYGILTIIWLFLGYFGAFDLGLARASAFHIAKLHDGAASKRADIFYTALTVNFVIGCAGGACLFFVVPVLFHLDLQISPETQASVLQALPFLALSVPVATVTGVMVGGLQAREAFGTVNSYGALNSFLVQVCPLLVAYFHGPQIGWLIIAVVLARLAGMIPFAVSCYRILPLNEGGGFDSRLLSGLFGYGGWIMVSTILDPFLNAMDRVLIGVIMSANAVAYYAVSYTFVLRISSLPLALSSSLFPRFSRNDNSGRADLASNAVIYLAAIITPVIVTGLAGFHIFMRLWLGQNFAAQAAPVGLILMLGVWINALSFIPYGQLQAANRPDITAKFHMIEILPFLLILWFGVKFAGLQGAAAAWSLRVTIDAGLLFAAARQYQALRRALPGALLVLAAFAMAPVEFFSLRFGVSLALIAVSLWWGSTLAPALYNMRNLRTILQR